MEYRREIDGLRTIAVVPVIFFHAGFAIFAGGFVGVDVFFVISGYLITTLIVSELNQGRFSILRFYERRARRILPALFFILLCCIPFAFLWMTPPQIKDFFAGVVAVSLFASNILFWFQSGYFAPEVGENPLIHTWSLAVEEQYYIIFPLLLLSLWRFGTRKVVAIVCILAALSLCLAEIAWRNYASANFFFAPTRAWELLAGSICAFLILYRGRQSNEFLALVGISLIALSIFTLDEATPFPSLFALMPVGGTALVILFATSGTFVAKMLSFKPLVGIGLISYSVYLWHQPLFAFSRIRTLFEPSVWEKWILIILSFLLAYLSWRFVELPFRRSKDKILPKQKQLLYGSAIALILFVVSGSVLHTYTDSIKKYEYNEYLIEYESMRKKTWDILIKNPDHSEEFRTFSTLASNERILNLLVLGDSHSKDIFNAVYMNSSIFDEVEVRRLDFQFGCYEAVGLFENSKNIIEKCFSKLMKRRSELFAQADWILFTARWKNKEKIVAMLSDILDALQNENPNIAITGTAPEYFDSKKIFRKVFSQYSPEKINKELIDRIFFNSLSGAVIGTNKKIKEIADNADIVFLEKLDYACDLERSICDGATKDLLPVHYDYGHYTLEGAKFMGERMHQSGWINPLLDTM